jgi:outer membrane biogenesis lipoprotein LolB
MKTFFITLVFSAASLLLLAQTEFTTEVKQISKNDTAEMGQASESELDYSYSTSGEVHENRDFVSITSVYPNPANKEANFDLEWYQQTTEAKIVISNLLGSVVREVELRDYVATCEDRYRKS